MGELQLKRAKDKIKNMDKNKHFDGECLMSFTEILE